MQQRTRCGPPPRAARAAFRPFSSRDRPAGTTTGSARRGAAAAPPQRREQLLQGQQQQERQQERGSLWQQVGLGLAAAGAAAAVALGPCAPPTRAVTSEQLLFLEAWRAVDRAYVDKTFNGQSWFKARAAVAAAAPHRTAPPSAAQRRSGGRPAAAHARPPAGAPQLRESYLKKEPMASRAQTYDAIRKLLSSLDDPFTRFLEPSRLAALRRGTAGSVTGVGLEITYGGGAGDDIVVQTPSPGGPADRAGVRAGDVLVSVDGTPTRGLSLYDASDLLQGAADSTVRLVLHAPGAPGASRTLELVRQRVSINPVTFATCTGVAPAVLPPGAAAPGKLGYLRLATFNSNTTAAAQEALAALDKAGVAGLVLDIRNNGGGLFPAGVNVARMLVDRGDLVLIADAAGVRDIYSADGNSIDSATPLVVLVNRGTASASEVLAGALKDSRRGVIAGERTFGKGLIQTVVDLSDGSGVAVTVARYQTPAGMDINKVGITPDVPLPPDALPTDADGVCRALAADAAPRLSSSQRRAQQQQQQPASGGTIAEYARAQEEQLARDRAMLDEYRKAWQQPRGLGHALLTHVRDVLWWMEHVCGINMLDYEEKVLVLLVFAAVLGLVALGAYNQGVQALGQLRELAAAGPRRASQ
ncbi:ctpA [Scenedesmus sp. PABB004]|nr:ctpA [Scenedesmus sp. PABB004]